MRRYGQGSGVGLQRKLRERSAYNGQRCAQAREALSAGRATSLRRAWPLGHRRRGDRGNDACDLRLAAAVRAKDRTRGAVLVRPSMIRICTPLVLLSVLAIAPCAWAQSDALDRKSTSMKSSH